MECGESTTKEKDEQIRWNINKCLEPAWFSFNNSVVNLICPTSLAEWCWSSRGCCLCPWRWTTLQLWALPGCPRNSSTCSSAICLRGHTGEEAMCRFWGKHRLEYRYWIVQIWTILILLVMQSACFKRSLTSLFLTPRWMLLESLQSSLLRCKLLEHLLDYACPLKTPLPMSLSLLLHFLKNCSLPPDPMVIYKFVKWAFPITFLKQ